MNFVQPIRDLEKIEEIRAILSRKSSRDCFMFDFGINTGLRISDIIPLMVKDVKNCTHVNLREKKPSKEKRFLINNELRVTIDKYIQGMSDDEYLFPSRKGGHIERVRAYEILNEAGKKAGLKSIATHSLRKTFGYHFYKKTKDVVTLQKLYNHSAPSVTLRYIGIEQDEIDDVVRNFSL